MGRRDSNNKSVYVILLFLEREYNHVPKVTVNGDESRMSRLNIKKNNDPLTSVFYATV